MAFIRTTSETKTDANLLVEIDVNAYNEIEVDIKRSGLCVLDESLTSDGWGVSGNGSNEGCTINSTGFRSVFKRSLTLEKEVSRLKWREEYLTICKDGSIHNAQDHRMASVSPMKNEVSKQCVNHINHKPKYLRENSESPQKYKDNKGVYMIAKSNMSYVKQTQEAAFYMETQENKDFSNCPQRVQENDSLPIELHKDNTEASLAFSSQPEEVKKAALRTHKRNGLKDVSNDIHQLPPVSYPQNLKNCTNEADVKNTLNDVMAKSIMIEETGKKLIQFLGSAIGQKLMMDYSNCKQKSDNNLSSGNLMDSTCSLNMERIKIIVDEICNVFQTQSSAIIDGDSSKLGQNPQERYTKKKLCSKDCFLTKRTTQPANIIEDEHRSRKEDPSVLLNKSERKIHHLHLKQPNRLHRNRYNTENYKEKSNAQAPHKHDISVNSTEDRKGLNNSVPLDNIDSGKKNIFSSLKETFNALFKNKLFEICTEKHVTSSQNKVEHPSVRNKGRSHTLGSPQRGEYSHTGAKNKNVPISINRGSHLPTRKLKNISKQTATATHTKSVQKLENCLPEYGVSRPRKKSQMPHSVASPKYDKSTKWSKDDFQKLFFELLETLCSKIKKKDLQRLSILLDILMKLQDQNLPASEETGNCTEVVACYNITQQTKEYTRESNMGHMHTISSNEENVTDASIEEQHEVCKSFFKTNSDSATKYEKCIQTNLMGKSEIIVSKNSIKRQVHTKFVSNTNQSKAVQISTQPKIDTVLESNMCPNNIHVQEDLIVSPIEASNKKNNSSKDCTNFIVNCGAEAMAEGENLSIAGSSKLLSHCRVQHQGQSDPENHNLVNKEEKTINTFLGLTSTPDANQYCNHMNSSVVSWQGTDDKTKCSVDQRESDYECSYEPVVHLDKIKKFVTIMGLSEAYGLYNNLTSSSMNQGKDNTNKDSEKQISTQVHKTAGVSSSLYKHAALHHDLLNNPINKINVVGVKINIPFPNEIIFPKTIKCYKKNLKIGKTLKFYLPFRIRSNNYVEFTAVESENKVVTHVIENDTDNSVTDDAKEKIGLLKEEVEFTAVESENKVVTHVIENDTDNSVTDDAKEKICLIKEEGVSERKCAVKPYLLASDKCFTLKKAQLHNVTMEPPKSNEQQMDVCQSIDDNKCSYNKVESNGVLHEASRIFLIQSTAENEATHTNNCYSYQYMHKSLSPWKLEDQVGSFMFGAYTKNELPVRSNLCMEDDLDSFGNHIPNPPTSNLVPPYDVKTFDIKIIGETREHDQKVQNSRKTMTKQLPTYFVFSAHDIQTSKENMPSHISRKRKKRSKNINDPQSSGSTEPQQIPSICLEPTSCIDSSASHPAVKGLDDSHIQNKKTKRTKIVHIHDFHTSSSPHKLQERKPLSITENFKDDLPMNVIPIKSSSNTTFKNIDLDNHLNSISYQPSTDEEFEPNAEYTEKNNTLRPSQLPFQLDTSKLLSSSVSLNDDTRAQNTPLESISNTPHQQSMESFVTNSNTKLNASLSETNQIQNIDHRETNANDSLSHNDFHTPQSPQQLQARKSPLSVKFKSDQRQHVYPTSSEEHVNNEQQESDYFPVKRSKRKHNILSSETEQLDKEIQSANKNDKLVAPQKNQISGEQSTNKKIKSMDRIKMLSEIDASDMEVAKNLDNVSRHLVSENQDKDKHFNVPLKPENDEESEDSPSTSVHERKPFAPKDSLLMLTKNKDDKTQAAASNADDSASTQSKKQRRVSSIFQKIFSPKSNEGSKENLSPMVASTDLHLSPSFQFVNVEQQEKSIKQVNFPSEEEKTTPSGLDYDKWRLSQSGKLLKKHHALIKEAHDLGVENGNNDDNREERVKIEQSTWDSCTPADFLLYFRRGFRDDQMTLNNKVCFVERMDLIGNEQEPIDNVIDLMTTCHPLDFLVKLGYSAEEAALISQDDEIKCRLYAAIREARVWANSITKPQAALLYLLAYKAKPKIMRYYLCMVESIINRRITNAVKLNELIDFLECLEDGEINLRDVFEEMAQSEALEEKKKTEDMYTVFHHMAEEEAMSIGKYPLSAKQIFLLQTLVSKYHVSLQDHLALLTRYIGRGLIRNTVQLEAALVYLPHVGKHSVNFEEFESYCGIKIKKKVK